MFAIALLSCSLSRILFSAWPGVTAQREGAGPGEPAEEEGVWAQQSEDQNQPASNLAQVCYFTISLSGRLQQATSMQTKVGPSLGYFIYFTFYKYDKEYLWHVNTV